MWKRALSGVTAAVVLCWPASAGAHAPPPGNPPPVGEFRTETRQTPRFPQAGSHALLTDIRTGLHDGFERVVFDFDRPADLGFRIGYVEKPPVASSGDPVGAAGEAMLDIHLTGASAFESTGPDPGRTYLGPLRFAPRGLDTVREIALVEDFEGHLRWVAGTDQAAPFAVTALAEPMRLVIDIATSAPPVAQEGQQESCPSPHRPRSSTPIPGGATVATSCPPAHPPILSPPTCRRATSP